MRQFAFCASFCQDRSKGGHVVIIPLKRNWNRQSLHLGRGICYQKFSDQYDLLTGTDQTRLLCLDTKQRLATYVTEFTSRSCFAELILVPRCLPYSPLLLWSFSFPAFLLSLLVAFCPEIQGINPQNLAWRKQGPWTDAPFLDVRNRRWVKVR